MHIDTEVTDSKGSLQETAILQTEREKDKEGRVVQRQTQAQKAAVKRY